MALLVLSSTQCTFTLVLSSSPQSFSSRFLPSPSRSIAFSPPCLSPHFSPVLSRGGQSKLHQNAARLSPFEAGHLPDALFFDCDGVLVDTEKDGHRVSFNKAFEELNLGVHWDVELYGKLLKIGGGKERMKHYFDEVGWPSFAPLAASERKSFLLSVHQTKTKLFMQMVEEGGLPLRPGVANLIDSALANGVPVAVCSTSALDSVSAIVTHLLGAERAQRMRIFAGDVVPKKKPDPAIYNLAAQTFKVDPQSCVVIEDSEIGLRAAKAAGMVCVVTKSGYTAHEDFSLADAVFDCIGGESKRGGKQNFGIDTLCRLVAKTKGEGE